MRVFGIIIAVGLALWQAGSVAARPVGQALPTGEIAKGRVQPVPKGELVVGVINYTIAGVGGHVAVGGPPGFLVSLDRGIQVQAESVNTGVRPGGAIFLQGGKEYTLSTTEDQDAPASFVFIGLGGRGEVAGAQYEMEPLPWGPGGGKVYDVSINREHFSANGATPWHYHTGPAFGVLDDGVWENRQASGSTVRIPTPGYYIQPDNKMHQLAQVGDGGTALIVQFYPPGEPKTGGGPGRGDATPTVLEAVTTAIPKPEAQATLPPPLIPTIVVAVAQATPTTPMALPTEVAKGDSNPGEVAQPTATATSGVSTGSGGDGTNAGLLAASVVTMSIVMLGAILGLRAWSVRRH